MAVPLDGIRAIHNAFRKDMATMDNAANIAAHGRGKLDLVLERYNFLNDVLVWHAEGEEKFVFPSLEQVAPLVYQPFEQDHRGLDSLYLMLKQAIGSNDLIEIARSTAAFNFHLRIHLDKEEAHLYKIFDERIPLPEQVTIAAKMSQQIPEKRFPETVKWLFSMIDMHDSENMTRIWMQSLPAPTFAMVAGLIQAALGSSWEELTNRIPELKSAARAT